MRKYLVFGAQRDTIGDVKYSARTDDHFGWLKCDGRSLDTTEYSLLFSIIGYSFGGSGSTFNLPNPAGRVLGVTGQGSGLSERNLGDTSGNETHTLTESELAEHTHIIDSSGVHNHSITDPGHTHSVSNTVKFSGDNTPSGLDDTGEEIDNKVTQNTTTTSSQTGITINNGGLHTHTAQTTGSNEPFSIIQPTLFMGNTFIYSGRRFVGTRSHTNQYHN